MISLKAGFVCKNLKVVIQSFFADSRWILSETKHLNFVYYGKTSKHLI